MEPIKSLESAIEKGDSLDQNALHFFTNTLWGNQYLNNTRSFDSAVNCISLDIADGDYFPAVSIRQANLFIKRLSVANKK